MSSKEEPKTDREEVQQQLERYWQLGLLKIAEDEDNVSTKADEDQNQTLKVDEEEQTNNTNNEQSLGGNISHAEVMPSLFKTEIQSQEDNADEARSSQEFNFLNCQNRHSEKKKGLLLTLEKRMQRLALEQEALDDGIRQLQLTGQKERENQEILQEMLKKVDNITPEMTKELEDFLKTIGL